MDFQTLATCLIAVTLLTITPGVDTLLVIRNSARGGWRDGVVSSFGICSGLFIHATVSALGISIILLQTACATLATLTGRVSSLLAQPHYSKIFHWITGSFLTFLGLRLLNEK